MERDRNYAKELKNFNAVWQRVRARNDLRSAAEAKGVPLMPRRQCRKRCGAASNLKSAPRFLQFPPTHGIM